jgi:hypothetical protein
LKNKDDKLLNNFESLENLEEFIKGKEDVLKKMDEEKQRKKTVSNVQKQIREKGELDVEELLKTNNVIVYKPKSEDGSKFYGRNTKWCTASINNNMFEYYNKKGPLYIIEFKDRRDEKNNIIKYQIQFETQQIMNSEDKQVNINEIIQNLNDVDFNRWLFEKYVNYLDSNKESKITDNFFPILKVNNIISSKPKIIIFDDKFNELLENSLINLTNLQSITFGANFYQPLGNSLIG